MNNFFFNDNQKQVFKETQQNMGASIENNHLLAALLERIKQQGKVDLIQQKVVSVKPAFQEWERPEV